MRYKLYIFLFFLFATGTAFAQKYYTVSHFNKQIIAGIEVEVVPIDTPNTYPMGDCGAGPYFIGSIPFIGTLSKATNGYEFRFSKAPRAIRYQVTASDDSEELITYVNGAFYPLIASEVSHFVGTCGNNGNSILKDGKIVFAPKTTRNNTQITINRNGMYSVALFAKFIQGGSIFGFQFLFDTTVAVVKYTDTLLCVGDTMHIPYEITGSFAPGNVFTFQLSDKNGSFANPYIMGTVNDTVSGVFKWVIPNTIAVGGDYRVRVRSSIPLFTSEANDKKIGIGHTPVIGTFTSAPVCENDTVVIGATSFSHVTDYKWKGPAFPQGFPSQHVRIPNAKAKDAGMYRVTAHDYGCVVYDSVLVELGPNPLTSISTNNSPVCAGDTLKLLGKVDSATAENTWYMPDGSTHSSLNVFLKAQLSDTGRYILVTKLKGCTAMDTAYIKVKQVPLPVVSDADICVGGSLKLQTQAIQGAVYSWIGPKGYTSFKQNDTLHNATADNSGEYIISVTMNGCTGRDTLHANVKPLPYPIKARSNAPLCAGEALGLFANDTMQSAVHYWTGPDNYNATGALHYINDIKEAASGRYILNADLNGCLRSDTINVVVKHAPDKPAGTSNSPIKAGTDLYLKIPVTEPGVGYTWKGPHSFGSTEFDPIIRNADVSHSGSYVVTASIDGCTSSSVVEVVVNEDLDSTMIVLYPNPNSGSFKVKALFKMDQRVALRITNAAGQEVYQATAETTGQMLYHEVKLKDALASGVYMLRITADADTQTIPFVVDRQ